MIGTTILHYRILEKLGEGGMGVVYKAEDTKLKRDVAIKFLPRQIAANEEDRQRFKIEAQAAAALNHPSIATVYAIEEHDDDMFIVMEYIDGQELRDMIEARHVVPLSEVLNYATQIAEGLRAAHEKGLTHRDIKSANIMITSGGGVKIMDFGLAKMPGGAQVTKVGTTLGTAAYMSPEQARGGEADARSDIWSYGVVLYEMLTAQLPFKGDYEHAVIYSILNEEPEYPDTIPENLKRILQMALSKSRSERYKNIDQLIDDLEGIAQDGQPDHPKGDKPWVKSRSVAYVSSAVGVLTVITAIWLFGYRSSGNETIDSIAVLPLENLSGDPTQDYFSDGMTEALITGLSKIRALKVISRTSVMQYKGARKPLPEIAKELGVKAIIEGSVMRDGDRVQITAQLIEAESDRHLWAESYDRDLTDIFTLQRDVARTIAEQVKATVTPEEKKQLQAARKIDPAAYEAYLKGVYHDTKYNSSDFLKSLDYYETVVEREPDFALGYVGIVRACTGLMDIGGLPYSELYPRAKAALEKALQLDKSQAEVYASAGHFKHVAEWDWDGAEKAFQESLELNPNVAQTYFEYAGFLISMGRKDEALEAINKSRSLDPLNPGINNDVGWTNYCARHYDEAIREYRDNIEKYPEFIMSHRELGWVYAKKGMFSEAIQSIKRAVELERSPYNLSQLSLVYAMAGQRDKAHKILEERLSKRKTEHLAAYEFAMVYTALDEFDKAFEWLEKSRQEHSGWPFFIKADPMAEPLHSDPRYAPFLRKMGLEP